MKIAKVLVGVKGPKTSKAGSVKRSIKLGYHTNSQVISVSDAGVKECYRIFKDQDELEDCMKKKENVWMHFELKYVMNDEAKERYENFVSGFLHYYDTEIRNGMTDHTFWCDWKKKKVTVYLDPAPLRHPKERSKEQPTLKTRGALKKDREKLNKIREDTIFNEDWKLPSVDPNESDPPGSGGPPPPRA